jgi:hypothetical protein
LRAIPVRKGGAASALTKAVALQRIGKRRRRMRARDRAALRRAKAFASIDRALAIQFRCRNLDVGDEQKFARIAQSVGMVGPWRFLSWRAFR